MRGGSSRNQESPGGIGGDGDGDHQAGETGLGESGGDLRAGGIGGVHTIVGSRGRCAGDRPGGSGGPRRSGSGSAPPSAGMHGSDRPGGSGGPGRSGSGSAPPSAGMHGSDRPGGSGGPGRSGSGSAPPSAGMHGSDRDVQRHLPWTDGRTHAGCRSDRGR
ncbi:PE-PGRS family protein PE_PGRS26-like [Triticum aestivum]|uniref:PE-PGRS family protein PE_PGRS26-like n=1 Tax=Triticum aestivum TaxID=4565 RepID=UPI001D02656B|nr:PE-PGRS family protein PE_PGRS26-like [Triticum aestivum]